MQATTLLIALLAVILVLYVRPTHGIVVYLAALAWYPIYLTIPVGTIDFTVCRIVIIAIYAKLLFGRELPYRFKFIWLDKLIIIYFVCQIIAGLQTMPVGRFLENRGGAIFNQVLPYFAVRISFTRKEQYLSLLKSILVIAAPLSLIGFYQCLTGRNPVGYLQQYAAFGAARNYVAISRIGFYRANVTFGETIMFGLFFAMLGPMCGGLLRNVRRNKWLYFGGIGLMALGVFSSMSSGALLAALLASVFILFYRYRRYWKPVTMVIILMCGSVEIISNRHFYDVLGGFTINPATSWYRSRLIDVALFEGGMSGHWLVGYGLRDPGWGPRIEGFERTDVVNHYIVVLACYGLVGLVPFIAIIGAAIRQIVIAFRRSTLDSEKWFIWCLSGSMFGILPAMMTVSLFGPAITVFYIMLGFCGVMPKLVNQQDSLVLDHTRSDMLHGLRLNRQL
ncbi:MAG: hypothetical protein ACYTDW_00085 [Planctomycetota bacterium]|jgi:hypothetical protein